MTRHQFIGTIIALVAAVGAFAGGMAQFGSFLFAMKDPKAPATHTAPAAAAPQPEASEGALTPVSTETVEAQPESADAPPPPPAATTESDPTAPTAGDALPDETKPPLENAFTIQPTGADDVTAKPAPPQQPKTIDLPHQPTGQ